MRLGAHIGITDGFDSAAHTAKKIGCESMQIFSKSPQMWKGAAISDESAAKFRAAVEEDAVTPIAIHHGYLLNLASPKAFMLKRSRGAFVDELARAEKLGVDQLIFHPGAHLGSGPEEGLRTIVESLNWAFAETPDLQVRALLENCAGQGTGLCGSFEELQGILDRLDHPERAGVVLDTCHLFAAGNDFRTEEQYGEMVDRIRDSIGAERVQAFHLNDAKAPLGSHLDRHENIGNGQIGVEGFRHLVNDPTWRTTPGYLETPIDDDEYTRYIEDLKTLRRLVVSLPKRLDRPTVEHRPPRKRSPRAGAKGAADS
jgi:deoxyribonuclease IV